MLVAITPRQWKGLQEALGVTAEITRLEDELGVSFAADDGLRFVHRARLFPIFERAFARRDLAGLAPAFETAGVCWGPYQAIETAMGDPRLFAGNPLFTDLVHPSGLTYPAPGAAATVPQDARAPARPAPRLGADTDEILADVLGLSGGEIGRLHDAGVV